MTRATDLADDMEALKARRREGRGVLDRVEQVGLDRLDGCPPLGLEARAWRSGLLRQVCRRAVESRGGVDREDQFRRAQRSHQLRHDAAAASAFPSLALQSSLPPGLQDAKDTAATSTCATTRRRRRR